MKAEQRKESPLAAVTERAGRFWKEVSGRPNTASIVFWGAVVLVAALGAGWVFYWRWETGVRATGWVRMLDADSVADLQAVAGEYPGTVPAEMAQFDQARVLLREGLEKYASANEKERAEAHDKIKQAGELYEKLAGQASQPLLVQEALWGAAKARESQGDLDGALQFYQKLAGQQPRTELVAQAEQSAKNLQDPEGRKKVEDFYKNLQTLIAPPPPEPVPAAPPAANPPGNKPAAGPGAKP